VCVCVCVCVCVWEFVEVCMCCSVELENANDNHTAHRWNTNKSANVESAARHATGRQGGDGRTALSTQAKWKQADDDELAWKREEVLLLCLPVDRLTC
jgi:hypothetical protein